MKNTVLFYDDEVTKCTTSKYKMLRHFLGVHLFPCGKKHVKFADAHFHMWNSCFHTLSSNYFWLWVSICPVTVSDCPTVCLFSPVRVPDCPPIISFSFSYLMSSDQKVTTTTRSAMCEIWLCVWRYNTSQKYNLVGLIHDFSLVGGRSRRVY
jgi:hypothetical protein